MNVASRRKLIESGKVAAAGLAGYVFAELTLSPGRSIRDLIATAILMVAMVMAAWFAFLRLRDSR